MPSDPADICRAPKDVFVAHIEDVFHRRINSDQITAGRVQDSLRFSGRAAGVENVKRMFAIERDRRTLGIDIFQLLMPPDVAAFFHVDLVAGAPKNDHPSDRGFAPQCVVDVFLQRNNCPATIPAIGRHHGNGFAVFDSIPDALRAESTENN